jgi:hypothetical protein
MTPPTPINNKSPQHHHDPLNDALDRLGEADRRALSNDAASRIARAAAATARTDGGVVARIGAWTPAWFGWRLAAGLAVVATAGVVTAALLLGSMPRPGTPEDPEAVAASEPLDVDAIEREFELITASFSEDDPWLDGFASSEGVVPETPEGFWRIGLDDDDLEELPITEGAL